MGRTIEPGENSRRLLSIEKKLGRRLTNTEFLPFQYRSSHCRHCKNVMKMVVITEEDFQTCQVVHDPCSGQPVVEGQPHIDPERRGMPYYMPHNPLRRTRMGRYVYVDTRIRNFTWTPADKHRVSSIPNAPNHLTKYNEGASSPALDEHPKKHKGNNEGDSSPTLDEHPKKHRGNNEAVSSRVDHSKKYKGNNEAVSSRVDHSKKHKGNNEAFSSRVDHSKKHNGTNEAVASPVFRDRSKQQFGNHDGSGLV